MRVGPRWRAGGVSAALAALLLHASPAIAQCAMCSTAIGSSARFARGFAISIVFLLSTLLLVVLAFVRLVLIRARSASAERAHAAHGRAAVAAAGWRLVLRRLASLP